MSNTPTVRRAVVKLSGETLAGKLGRGIDFEMLDRVCRVLAECASLGVELGVVVGAGNFWRGVKDGGGKLDRVRADHMGMLATTMNAIAIGDALERAGAAPLVLSATPMPAYADTYSPDRARRALSEGKIVVVGGGTGNPYVSTDTGVVLRALEIGADAILVAKNGVEGVLTGDPRDGGDYELIDAITFDELLARNLKVMDATAFEMCRENGMTMHIFGMDDVENIYRAACGEKLGTQVTVD